MDLTVYIQTNGMSCRVVDSYGIVTSNRPEALLGIDSVLKINIVEDGATAAELEHFASFRAVIDNDWNHQTPPPVLVTEGIVQADNIISVPLALDTAGMRERLGTAQKINMNFELICYRMDGGQPVAALGLQFNMAVVNRLDLDTTEPTSEEQGNFYNKAQTDALLAAVDTAQVATVTRYNAEISGLEYSEEFGYYRALTAPGDMLSMLYNVTECVSLALHVRSANPTITGIVAVAIKANGVTLQNAAIPVGAAAAWHEVMFDGYVDGALSVELTKGLTDGEAPVSVIVDGVRLTCKLISDTVGRVERQVSAGPLGYSDVVGYTLRLDEDYGVNLRQPVNGLLAVALRLKSANSEISGNVAVNVLVNGVAVKTCSIPVGTAAAWQLIALDAAASGAVTLTRDTSSADDTLKDGGAVVSAIVADLNFYYLEQAL